MKPSRRPHLQARLSPIAIGCALLAIQASALAQQQAPAPAPQASSLAPVQITGIRASIESAISTKRDAVGVVEAIAPEDLGKLPDTSIADSIARLPGVAAQRSAEGRAQQLSIRGMPPDFSTTLLNGREQTNPNDSRGVEYDAYPAELINGVVLHKTPDASLMGQGIAGTVNMSTVRPLSLKQSRIQFGVSHQFNSKGVGPTGSADNFSFSYIGQLSPMVGFALGLTRSSGTSYSKETSFWDQAEKFGTGQKLPFPKNLALDNRKNDWTREGAMAVLEFKPSRNFSSIIDVYSSTTDRQSISRKILFPDMNSGTLSNANVVGGVAMSGTITNRGNDHVIQAVGNDAHDKNFAIGWNNKWQFSDASTVVLDLSKSRSTRNELVLDSNASFAGAKTALTYDFNGGSPIFGSSFNFANSAGLSLGSNWGNGWLKKPAVRDDLDSVRLEFRHLLDHDVFREFVVGANVSSRSKVLRMTEGSVDPKTTAVPVEGFVNVGYNSSLSIPAWNSLDLVNGVYKYTDMGNQWWAMNKNWSVDEDVRTLYTKLDIDTKVMGRNVRGNIGLQAVSTRQSSTGAANQTVATWANGPTCPGGGASDGGNCYVYQVAGGSRTESYKYSDVLPSLNLAIDLSPDQVLRAGVGKMVARPTMRDLRANSLFECWSPASDPKSCSGNKSGSGGNPTLEPFRATTFDLGLEHYFGKRAYVGVAGFYRDLDTFIYTETVQKDLVNPALKTTGYPLLNYSSPKNGKGGRISGFELTANAPLDLVSPMLKGWGVYISHSDTSSAIDLPNAAGGSSTRMEMPGLSKRVTNLSVYYEQGGFSVRVGQRSRSDFVGEITTNEYERQNRFVRGEKIFDAQIGYEFRSGQFRGLTLLLQGNNITNESFETYSINSDGSKEPRSKVNFGRSFMLSANYKF